jgi:hypothetical protein
MGATEDAVDAAANFIGPFVDKDRNYSGNVSTSSLVADALSHLQAINTADLAADPNAPYDASLAGVVYGLLDLITTLAIIPRLSPGVAFSQRPRSVLTAVIFTPPNGDLIVLAECLERLLPILQQKGSGVQPLLSQRMLPDIISALAELAFSPASTEQARFSEIYNKIIGDIPTSRLLPTLTTFLQQSLPTWLKPVISEALSMIPLRQHGVRHTIEFLSLSYLSKNSHVPRDASGSQLQIPIPLEAVTQASKLLVLPPTGFTQDKWIVALSPELWSQLDGNAGKELSRAAGQIIAGGILSKKTTGAPGTVGWETFARPLLQTIYPKDSKKPNVFGDTEQEVIIKENEFKTGLRRLKAIASSYSHAGLLRRLVGPLLLPLWALLNYAKAKPSLDKEWTVLSSSILSRYMEIACDAKQVDSIATNMFWDGDTPWTLGPGSEGGVAIRWRPKQKDERMQAMDSIFEHIGGLDTRVNILVSLLSEAKISDDVAGSIFLNATKRWLTPLKPTNTSLIDDDSMGDPIAALVDAKFSETMARTFQEHFARSPQHIIELMAQLIQNYVSSHTAKAEESAKTRTSKKAMLGNIVQKPNAEDGEEGETPDEDLISFALSILNTLLSSPDFKNTSSVTNSLRVLLPSLVYIAHPPAQQITPPLLSNSASTLVHLIMPPSTSNAPANPLTNDPLHEHRATLHTILTDLQSPDPPNRTWALRTLHTLLKNPTAFPVVDVPSLTHTLLSASLADPESYVHMAAIPVIVCLAERAPRPVVGILVDAFTDIDERSLKLARGRQTEEKERELREALDYRLRVSEVLDTFLLSAGVWETETPGEAVPMRKLMKKMVEACLSLASRRGQRTQTLSTRTTLAFQAQKEQEEAEAAWSGPIPNLFEPEGADPQEMAEYTALQKIVNGWEETGIEEDVRIRASALSILSTVFEHRLQSLGQASVDAGLQIVLLILTMEREEAKAILRRAAVLVIMGLLRGVDAALERGNKSTVSLSLSQQGEVERLVQWVKDEDSDELVRDHAGSVVEGLETLRLKKLYRVRDKGLRLGPDLGLEGNLRGLDIQRNVGKDEGKRKMVIEEIE